MLESEARIKVVGEAGRADEAFNTLSSRAVDVMLMDIKLPGMDGIEATRWLKDHSPDLKVVMITSYGDDYLAEAIEAGANGYILKSATQPELVTAVIQAAQGHSPIDPTLTGGLFDQFAKVSKIARNQGMSSRQLEILRLIAEGVPSKSIASQLAISDTTLKREIKAIFNFLGVNDRAHAIAEAYNRQFL